MFIFCRVERVVANQMAEPQTPAVYTNAEKKNRIILSRLSTYFSAQEVLPVAR